MMKTTSSTPYTRLSHPTARVPKEMRSTSASMIVITAPTVGPRDT
jgi:hypothetical protein